MSTSNQKKQKVVLAVGAHPDDLELGCGGTLARLAKAGVRVVMAVVSVPGLLEVRKAEGQRAAEILGCEVRFLVPDRETRVEDLKNHKLISLIDDLVKDLAPVAIFSHAEDNTHLDHTLVYRASMATHRLGDFDHFCYAPISCRAANIGFTPNTFVDVSEYIDLKMRAISSHASQFENRSLGISHVQELASYCGKLIGVRYAEGFQVVRQKIVPEYFALKSDVLEEISRIKSEVESHDYEMEALPSQHSRPGNGNVKL